MSQISSWERELVDKWNQEEDGAAQDRVRPVMEVAAGKTAAQTVADGKLAEKLGFTPEVIAEQREWAQREQTARTIVQRPKLARWATAEPENMTFVQEDPVLADMYDDLESNGIISSGEVDREVVATAGEAGKDMSNAWARGNLQIEASDLAHAYSNGDITAEEFYRRADKLKAKMKASEGGADPFGFSSAIEQLPRMIKRDLPAAMEWGIKGATTAGAAGAAAGMGAGSWATGPAAAAAGFTAGAAAGGYEAASRIESGSMMFDLLTEKDENGKYITDIDTVRAFSQGYGIFSGLIESGSDLLVGKLMGLGGLVKKGFGVKASARDAIKAAMAKSSLRPVVTDFAKGMGGTALTEAGEEGTQQIGQNVATAMLKNDLQSRGENDFGGEQDPFDAKSMRAVGEAAWTAMKMAPWLYLIPGGIKAISQGRAAVNATDFSESNKVFAEKLAATKDLKESPARAESFLQTIGMNGNVLIPADAAWQIQQGGTDICSMLGWEQSSLEEAAVMGEEMSIPLARIHARLATNPEVMNQVADIMRESPAAMSAVEAADLNANLDSDLDQIAEQAEQDSFDRSAMEAEIDRLRYEIEGAIRSVPSMMAQINASADPEMSVRQQVDDVMLQLLGRASVVEKAGLESGADFLGRMSYQGLVKGLDGKWITPGEADQQLEVQARRESLEPFWQSVWGRLDRDSLKASFPDAPRELVKIHGKGIFGKKGSGVAVDELADELKRQGVLPEDATDSDLVEKLKELERPTWRGRKGGSLNQRNILADRFASMPFVTLNTADFFGEGKDLPAIPEGDWSKEQANSIRNSIKKWSKNTFTDDHIERNADMGWDVILSPSGVKTTLSHGFEPLLAKSVPAIPQIIQTGIYIDSFEKHPGLMSHLFANKINIDGKKYVVGFVLREDGNGNRFYDHELTKIINPDQLAPGKQLDAAEHRTDRDYASNTGVVMNILRDKLGVNDGTATVYFQTSADGQQLSAGQAGSLDSLIPLMQTAYNGSPNKFDKFSIDHIGEGEGGAAHGWGLYFALDKSTSVEYASRLSKRGKGHLYRVDIPEDDVMLREDEPFKKQPEIVQNAIKNIIKGISKEKAEQIRNEAAAQVRVIYPNREITMLSNQTIPALKTQIAQVRNFAKGEAAFEGKKSFGSQTVWENINRVLNKYYTSEELESLSDPQMAEEEAKRLEGVLAKHEDTVFNDEVVRETKRVEQKQKIMKSTLLNLFKAGTGGDMYKYITIALGNPKQASLALNAEGVEGIRYRGVSDGECAVVFNDSAIKETTRLYQSGNSGMAQGMMTPTEDGRYLIQLFAGANISTLSHETSHAFFLDMQRRVLDGSADEGMVKDWGLLQEWLGQLDDEKVLREQYDMYVRHNAAFGERDFDSLDATEKQLAKQIAGQEMLARGWEQYLLEGTSPSSKLDGFFRRMAKWMKRIYQAATSLNVQITDEVRGVFDRMIAVDHEMDNAAERADIREETASLMDRLGLKGKARLEIEGLINDAKEEAAAKMRIVRDQGRRERMAKWTREARQNVEEEQAYVMAKMLKATPLSQADLIDVVGEEKAKQLSKRFPGTVKQDGTVEPEMFAFDHGYANAADMVQDMLSKPSKKERVKELVRQMEERYDETFDADSYLWEQDQIAKQQDIIAKALDEKIAEITSKARYDNELSGKTVGGQEVSPSAYDWIDYGNRARWKVGRDQLKRQAQAYLEKQRMQEAIQPERFRRAASKWINEERRAILKGKWQKAMEANYKARINIELARQSADLRDANTKLQDHVRKFLNMDLKNTLRGMSDRDVKAVQGARLAVSQIVNMTGIVNLPKKAIANMDGKTVEDVRDFFKIMGEEGLLQVFDDQAGNTICLQIDSMVFTQQLPWQNAPVSEWQAYHEAMAIIMHVDKVFRKGTTEANAISWQDRIKGIVDSIYANNKTRQQHPYAKHNKKTIGDILRGFHAEHLKAETMVLLFDGDAMGPAFDSIIRPINRADDAQKSRLLAERTNVRKLFSVYSRKELVDMKSKPVFVDEIGMPLTKEQALACLLNFGNDSNAQRLMSGFEINGQPIREDQLTAIFDTILDEKDFRFAQSVWDYFETFKKESFDLEESITGVRPKSVEARPLQTKYGMLRGGYYPVVYDKTMSALPIDTDTIGTKTGSMFASVDHGSMKARSAAGLGKPLSLSIDVIPSHVSKTVHMLSFRKPVIEVARVLNNKEVMAAIENTVGPEQAKSLKEWLHYVAGERPAKNVWSKAAGWARKNASLFTMGFKLTTAIAQTTGLLATTAEIGPKWVAVGASKFYRHPVASYQFACSVSPMMATRLKSIDREVFEMSTKIMDTGSKYAALDPAVRMKTFIEDHAYDLMGWVQMLSADMPTWMGAYEKGLAENNGDMAKAREYADSILARTQVGGSDKDLAGIQRGEELGKLLTMFYSYFSALYQLSARRVTMLNRNRDAGSAFRLASLAMLCWFAEPVISGTLLGKSPDADDDESWLGWAAAEALKNPFNMVVGVRDVAAFIDGIVNGFGRGFRLSSSLDVFDSFGKFGVQIYKAIDPDKTTDTKNTTISGLKAFGQASGGIINAQEIRLLEAFWDWLDGTKPEFELMDLVRKKRNK